MAITLTINGQTVCAESGQTVLEAARTHDIYIPTLCDYPGLPSHGSCRMCIVEVQGRPNTPTACTTPVEDGMVVQTETEKLIELRRDLLRMLLAEHPSGCLFCPENKHCSECMVTLRKAGVTTGCRSCPADQQCDLQNMVERYEVSGVAYPVRYRALRVEKFDPFFDRDYNLCVLCGRCIRACEALHFTNIPTYVRRGSETRVGVSFDRSHLEAGCAFCGACVEACPTGSLMEKTRKWDGPADGETESTCSFCALGCQIRLQTRGGEIIGSLPGAGETALCVLGRFGVTETVSHARRIKKARRLEGGLDQPESLEDALIRAAARLGSCQPGELALVISASCSNEEMYLARKLAREGLGNAPLYLDAVGRYVANFNGAARLLQSSQAVVAIDSADALLCVGLDARHIQSPVEVRLKRARERGAFIATLNAENHAPGRFANLWLQPLPGEEYLLLHRISQAASQHSSESSPQIEKLLDGLRAVENVLLVIGPEAVENYPDAVLELVETLGAQVLVLSAQANLRGALNLGLEAHLSAAQPKVIYLIGAALPNMVGAHPFIIYQNSHLPERLPPEGVLLPAAGIGEFEGSLTDQAGKVKPMRAAAVPPGEALPGWLLLTRLARLVGCGGFEYETIDQVRAEMNADQHEAIPAAKSFELEVPGWLSTPGRFDTMGYSLAEWVEGLRVLPPYLAGAENREVKHVQPA